MDAYATAPVVDSATTDRGGTDAPQYSDQCLLGQFFSEFAFDSDGGASGQVRIAGRDARPL